MGQIFKVGYGEYPPYSEVIKQNPLELHGFFVELVEIFCFQTNLTLEFGHGLGSTQNSYASRYQDNVMV